MATDVFSVGIERLKKENEATQQGERSYVVISIGPF